MILGHAVRLTCSSKGYLHLHRGCVEQVAESDYCGQPDWTKGAGLGSAFRLCQGHEVTQLLAIYDSSISVRS